MTDQEQELAYLDESALLAQPSFTSTNKRGYVEDEVDHWVKQVAADVETLVNDYNLLAYRCMTAESNLSETVAENEALRQQLAAAEAAVANPAPVTVEEPVNNYDYQEPVIEESPDVEIPAEPETNSYAYVEPEPEVYVEPTPAAVEEPVAPVSEVALASARAQRILDAAAQEASAHVSRALERVAAVELEAEEEATALVTEAGNKAEEIITTAETEAVRIQEAAVEASADALERLRAAKVHTETLFSRVQAFHEFSLEQAKSVFEFATKTDEEPAPAVVAVAVVEPVVEVVEVETYEAVAYEPEEELENTVETGDEETFSYATPVAEETVEEITLVETPAEEVVEEYNYENPVVEEEVETFTVSEPVVEEAASEETTETEEDYRY